MQKTTIYTSNTNQQEGDVPVAVSILSQLLAFDKNDDDDDDDDVAVSPQELNITVLRASEDDNEDHENNNWCPQNALLQTQFPFGHSYRGRSITRTRVSKLSLGVASS